MIEPMLEGFALGLLLSILAGPIFFAILQLGIERGPKSATILASGQWVSDIMYILIVIWGSTYIDDLINDPTLRDQFVIYMGSFGTLVLSIMGIGLWVGKPPNLEKQEAAGKKIIGEKNNKKEKISEFKLNLQFFIKGLLINTANPTPLFFWATLMATAILDGYSDIQVYILFISVMTMVVFTDLLKVYLAKNIRKWLKIHHLIYVRKIAGTVLIGFSVFLVVQVLRTIL
ncbi:MAG: LysE family transporter [Saprospiraceae bacterium]|nr:LysE family transporter [Saprospiraceae bacterium]